MKNLSILRIVLIVALLLVNPVVGYCGSKVEGTYGGGNLLLELRSGGKAALTMFGETAECTYKVKGNKLMLDCTPQGEKIEFTIHDDGSLTPPPGSMVGVLEKRGRK